jgi:hypothetical protein
MRRYFGPAAVLLAALLSGPPVQAQQPPPDTACVSTSLQTPDCVCPPPSDPAALPCCPPTRSVFERQPLFAAQLMLGQETGVRGQFAVYSDHREAVVIEGFYGELFHNLGSAQALGAGGRYLWRTTWLDCVDSLVFGPGVDVFFQLNHHGLVLLTPSIDLAWVHSLGGGLEWEIGLDAGLGTGVAGRTKNDHSGVGDVTPLISVYIGLRF